MLLTRLKISEINYIAFMNPSSEKNVESYIHTIKPQLNLIRI